LPNEVIVLTLEAAGHYDRFEELLRATGTQSLLEVFGGWGNMAARAEAVGVVETMIELDTDRADQLRARFTTADVNTENVFDVLPQFVKERRRFDFVDVDNNSRSLRKTLLPWRRSSFEHFDLVPYAFQLADKYVRFCIIQGAASSAFLKHCNKPAIDKPIRRMVRARERFYGTDEPSVEQMVAAYRREARRFGVDVELADWHPYNQSHGRLTLAVRPRT
jgi:hypothetical protein